MMNKLKLATFFLALMLSFIGIGCSTADMTSDNFSPEFANAPIAGARMVYCIDVAPNSEECDLLNGLDQRSAMVVWTDEVAYAVDVINTKFNEFPERDDVGDTWNGLEANGGYGDCDDFVISKKNALVATGLVPEAAMGIVELTNTWGDGHAVLGIRTDRGVMFLNNLTPYVESYGEIDRMWDFTYVPENLSMPL